MLRKDVNVQLPAGAVLPVSPSAMIAGAVRRGALTEVRAAELLTAAADGENVSWVADLWGPGRPLAATAAARPSRPSRSSSGDSLYDVLWPDQERARAAIEAREAEQAKLVGRFAGYQPDPVMRMPDHDGQ